MISQSSKLDGTKVFLDIKTSDKPENHKNLISEKPEASNNIIMNCHAVIINICCRGKYDL